MAKLTDYPRASLRSALQLTEAVDGFAGSCSPELAAEKLGKKMSGAFSALIASASKYGLIDNKGGKLTVCPLYRSYKLSYTPDEATTHLREALLSPPLFNAIYERFQGQKLPIEHFEKMLIKEFDVPDDMASRVAGYFLEGAKQAALLSSENILAVNNEVQKVDGGEDENTSRSIVPVVVPKEETYESHAIDAKQKAGVGAGVVMEDFWLNIRGPGMNFSIEIKELDDLDIVQIMLRKIEKALKQAETNAS